jgi:hypothetical protein
VKALGTTRSIEVTANSAVHCSIEHCSTVIYSMVHNVIVQYSTLHYSAVLYSLYCTVNCGAVQYRLEVGQSAYEGSGSYVRES